jgi:hypothetical protein
MVILLKDNEITDNTILGGNIDVDRLRICIQDAQETRLEELLGVTLYQKMCEDFDNDVLTDDYLILRNDYIKPFLIRQGALEFLKIGAFTFGNNGISIPTPQNTTAITSDMLGELINGMRQKADMYAERLHKFLIKTNFTEYGESCEGQKPSWGNWYFE